MDMTIEAVKKKIEQCQKDVDEIYKEQRLYKLAHPLLNTTNDIIDENKSVKWNREEVHRRNEERRQTVKTYQDKISKKQLALQDTFLQYIEEEYSMSEATAKIIFNYAYERGHAYGYYEVLAHIDHYAEFAAKTFKTMSSED